VRVKNKIYIWVSVWWKTKNESWGIYTTRIHWVDRGTGTPKDRVEVNRREEKKIGKIAGGLFRISRMTNSFKLNKNHVVSTVPTVKYRTLKTFQISWNFEASVVQVISQKWNGVVFLLVCRSLDPSIFVYYESINRDLKIRPIYECRCDERLKTNAKEFTRLGYTGLIGGLEHLKIETRLIPRLYRDVCEDGWVCVVERSLFSSE